MAAPISDDFRKFPSYIVKGSQKIRECVDYGRLRTNAEGLYSTILPPYVRQVIRVIKLHFPEPLRILDSTANIGGDAVNFAHNFPEARVTAVEVCSEVIPILARNVDALGFGGRVDIVEADCVSLVKTLGSEPYDFVYCDPPWGGPDQWRLHDKVMLYLDGPDPVPVHEFVAQIFDLGVSRAVVLKTLLNFDVETFRRGLGRECAISCEMIKKGGRGAQPAYRLYVIRDTSAASANSAIPTTVSANSAASDGKTEVAE